MVLKGAKFVDGEPVANDPVVATARRAATKILRRGAWPELYFGIDGETGPQLKTYLRDVKRGKIVMTYWADEDYETPIDIESQSWDHAESGHSQTGITELDAVVGKNHNFKTAKPLRLFKKIIQVWCRPADAIVMDPFAGSGTTAQATLELNKDTGASRRFVLIEQGNDEKGDHYAKTLTADRVRRVIKGEWKAGKRDPLGGGFRFVELKKTQVDAAAVSALEREEMIDLLLTSYWDKAEKAKSYLTRFPAGTHRFLFGTNPKNEGFFLVWTGADKPSVLDRDTFKLIAEEARKHSLATKYHVYATLATYTGRTVEFYKIPDRVLEHIGFNTRADAYNNEKAEAAE
jgi:adenine-specific DNA-methyltransferase